MVQAVLSKIKYIKNDFLASVIVFLVALPLSMGIALASNAPIMSGLLAGIVGGIVVGFFSGSHTSVSGAAAGLCAVVIGQIEALGSFELFLCAVMVSGFLQMLMGYLRLGSISSLFPTSVINALLAAVGIILILKQIPHLVGFDTDFEGDLAFLQANNENTFSSLLHMFSAFHMGALIVGVSSLIIFLSWQKLPYIKELGIPVPLAVVFTGTLISLILPFFNESFYLEDIHRVRVPVVSSFSEIPKFFVFPDWSGFLNPAVYFSGMVIALVASLATLLNLEAVDKIDPLRRWSPPNQELKAQGIGNVLLGLIGGLPVASVIIRSSVNIDSNAKSKNSAIFHGLLLMICVVLLPNMLNSIPLSTLAALLIVTGYRLASIKLFKQMWGRKKEQFIPFIITVLAILFTDLLIGVLIGLVAALSFILHSSFKNPFTMVSEVHPEQGIERIVLSNQLSFLNKAIIKETLQQIKEGQHVILDASNTNYIDNDIVQLINEFKDVESKEKNIEVSLLGFKEMHPINNHVKYAETISKDVQNKISPESVLSVLKEGNKRLISGKPIKRDLKKQIITTASGQFPIAAVLSCIDSRVPVEMVFDQGIGDVFSARIAGNIVNEHLLGSIEFACSVAGSKMIIVMGHTKCGAVSAAFQTLNSKATIEDQTGCFNLGSVVNEIQRSVPSKLLKSQLLDAELLAKINLEQSMRQILIQSDAIRDLVKQKKVGIAGCIYNVDTGVVDFITSEDKIYDLSLLDYNAKGYLQKLSHQPMVEA